MSGNLGDNPRRSAPAFLKTASDMAVVKERDREQLTVLSDEEVQFKMCVRPAHFVTTRD